MLAAVGEWDVSEVDRIDAKLDQISERVGELRVSVGELMSRSEQVSDLRERMRDQEERIRRVETSNAKLIAYAAVAGTGTAAVVGALFQLLAR